MDSIIIPTLSSQYPILREPEHKIAYILRSAVYTPGELSTIFADEVVSAQEIFATIPSREGAGNRLADKLSLAMTRACGFKVLVESNTVQESSEDRADTWESVKLSIESGDPHHSLSMSGIIQIDNDGGLHLNMK